jgi:hypothetical protein
MNDYIQILRRAGVTAGALSQLFLMIAHRLEQEPDLNVVQCADLLLEESQTTAHWLKVDLMEILRRHEQELNRAMVPQLEAVHE